MLDVSVIALFTSNWRFLISNWRFFSTQIIFASLGYQTILERVRAEALAGGRDPKEITVIAVSKGRSIEQIRQVYREGCRHFGENRLGEYLEKRDQLGR